MNEYATNILNNLKKDFTYIKYKDFKNYILFEVTTDILYLNNDHIVVSVKIYKDKTKLILFSDEIINLLLNISYIENILKYFFIDVVLDLDNNVIYKKINMYNIDNIKLLINDFAALIKSLNIIDNTKSLDNN